MANYDAIIIGAGHNGLVTAAYLAKGGKKVLVLERRSNVGGIAATEEIFSGFKYSTCAHLAASFASEIVTDLDLRRHGFELLALDPLLFAPSLNGQALTIPRDRTKADAEIARHSKATAIGTTLSARWRKISPGFSELFTACRCRTKPTTRASTPPSL